MARTKIVGYLDAEGLDDDDKNLIDGSLSMMGIMDVTITEVEDE